jgi:hypothetical protein
MGQLVIDFELLVTNLYSFWARSTGPEGSLPFYEEKPWGMLCQDSNVGRDAHGTRTPRY